MASVQRRSLSAKATSTSACWPVLVLLIVLALAESAAAARQGWLASGAAALGSHPRPEPVVFQKRSNPRALLAGARPPTQRRIQQVNAAAGAAAGMAQNVANTVSAAANAVSSSGGAGSSFAVASSSAGAGSGSGMPLAGFLPVPQSGLLPSAIFNGAAAAAATKTVTADNINAFGNLLQKDSLMPLNTELQDALLLHNRYRSQHGVPVLTWSKSLAQSAQGRADSCGSEPGKDPHKSMAWGYPTFAAVVRAWYSEASGYNYDTTTVPEDRLHFVHMIWKETQQLGCGYSPSCKFYVCLYSPQEDTSKGDAPSHVPKPNSATGP